MTELDRRAILPSAGACLAGIVGALVLPGTVAAARRDADRPEWGYSGGIGPERWGDLDPDWHACKTGTEQSPIDLPSTRPEAPSSPSVTLRYKAGPVAAVDTGHAIRFVAGDENVAIIDGREFRLVQFHEHTPSEHTVGGRAYPAELHFVHAGEGGRHAVLGLFLERSTKRGPADELLEALPPGLDDKQTILRSFDVSRLFPREGIAFRYPGSFTTPGCEEGIDWFVLRQPVPASVAALEAIETPHPGNVRPVQPLNGRTIASARIHA